MIRALSSLSDPADLAALLEAGGSRDVRVESIEVPVRFPAIGSLVDLSLALLAVMGHAKIIAEDARAITEDLESALAPHRDEEGFRLPMETHLGVGVAA